MYMRSFVRLSNLIGECHLNGITPIGLNGRTWELVVDENHGLLDSIWRTDSTLDDPIKGPSNTSIRGLATTKRVGIVTGHTSPRKATSDGLKRGTSAYTLEKSTCTTHTVRKEPWKTGRRAVRYDRDRK